MTTYIDQVRRDGEATISRHTKFFVIRQLFWIGPPIRRWEEDYRVIETGDFNDLIRELPRLDGPVAVTAVDVHAGTASDISKDAALAVAERIRDGEFSLTDDLRGFVEEHFSPGSVIPAAA